MRTLLVAIGALALLLAAALAVAPGFLDPETAKPRLEAELSRLAGRPVAIDGALSFTLLPRPSVSAEGLRVANHPSGSEAELLRVTRLELRLAPLPLLTGSFDVQSLRLVRPVLLLERLEDGSGNWAAGEERWLPAESGLLESISLQAVELRDAELVWRDHKAGREERLSGIDALLSAESLRGAVSTQGRLLYRNRELAFDLGIGREDRQGRQAISLQLALPEAAGAELRLTGRAAGIGTPGPGFAGRLALRAPETEALLLELGIEPQPGLALGQALSLEAALSWQEEVFTLDELEIGLGSERITGELRLLAGPLPHLDLSLATAGLDLDSLLSAGAWQWPRFQLTHHVTGDVSVAVDRLVLQGQSLRRLRLAARLEGGRLLLDEGTVLLPGGGGLQLRGEVANGGGALTFDGQVETQSTNLRAQLDWLGLLPPGADSDRLRRFSLNTAVSARPDLITFSDLTLDLDLTRVTGAVALAPRRRPALGLRLVVDRFDLDAYHDPLLLPGPEVLTRFDANLELQAERLILRGRIADDVSLDATLQRGDLELRRLEIGDIAGARLQGSGSLIGLADAEPRLENGSLDLQADDSGRLLRALGVAWPGPLYRLGPLSLSGSLSGTGNAAELNLDLAALDAVALLALRLRDQEGRLEIEEGFLDVDGLPADALAALLGYEDAVWASRLGRLDGESHFAGNGDSLRHDSRLGLAEGEVRLRGDTLRPAGPDPETRAALTLSHPDARQLVQRLTGRDPALPAAALSLEAEIEVAGGRVTAEGLSGQLDAAAFSGRAERTLGSLPARLVLDLALEALPGRALLAPFLSPALLDGELLDDNDRWSRQPLELAGLLGPELDARLSIGRLLLGEAAPLTEVVLEARLEGGRLTLERFSGQLEEARLELQGHLAARPPELLEGGLLLRAERLPADLLAGLATDLSARQPADSGRLDLMLRLESRGRSPAELLAGLDGRAQLEGHLRPAAVPLPEEGPVALALTRLLRDLNGEEALLDARLTAAEGSVRVESLRLEGPRRLLVLEGLLADLPRRRSDYAARLESLADGRPLLVLEVAGPFADPSVQLRSGTGAAGSGAAVVRELSSSPGLSPGGRPFPAGSEPRRP